MLQPIELLEAELTRLRDIAKAKEQNGIKAEENRMIPAYENSIKFMYAINNVDAGEHRQIYKYIVSQKDKLKLRDLSSFCYECGCSMVPDFYGNLVCDNEDCKECNY